ncbi:small secreted domain DUF320 [Streptomyces sp. Amel2xB2]|uniref:chaplin n=1 Tax=Streptomyces sp. Amel2xB2 TaxID=1305829 RepID=UPI000DB981AD|nr:chaplin [Streptomyces sp. Amel2xB2]RAJ60021.1 small secreted domain DUF320 [Streptomyces sp. Amel2xB2]
MRQVTRKGLITVAAAGGVLATISGGTAFADQGAAGSAANSPGVLSGNNVQVPVNVDADVCGNTVSVLGALNPSSGVDCSGGGSSQTSGSAQGSEGIGSGNNIEAPINAPVDVCGNSVSVVGIGNTADCGDEASTPPADDEPDNPGPGTPDNPGTDTPGSENPGADNPGDSGTSPQTTPASDVRTQSEPVTGELAHTGAGDMVAYGAPLSAGLLVGGFVLYRRAARMARR